MEVCNKQPVVPELPDKVVEDRQQEIAKDNNVKIGKINDYSANQNTTSNGQHRRQEEEEEEEEEEEDGEEEEEEELEGGEMRGRHHQEEEELEEEEEVEEEEEEEEEVEEEEEEEEEEEVQTHPSQGKHHHQQSQLHHQSQSQLIPNGELNGHANESTTKNTGNSVYEGHSQGNRHVPHHTNHPNHQHGPTSTDRSNSGGGLTEGTNSSQGGGIKREPEGESQDDSSQIAEDDSVVESYEGDDCYPLDDPNSMGAGGVGANQAPRVGYDTIVRRGRGRPRGSKNRADGRGRGRGFKFRRLSEDRTCTAYDLRNIPDPFANQRRGRPRSRFIVDLGEQNHEAWCKNKEELNVSDAELTTLLLSLLESRRDCANAEDSDTMLGLIASEYSKWKEKFSSQVSMLSHYSSIHNTNCCTCLGIKKKKYIPAGTGKRGRPRKYPPPVGYGPGMQRPDTIDEDGNIFEPQIILKDGMVVKNEPSEESKAMHAGENGPNSMGMGSPGGGPHGSAGMQMLPRPILTKEEIEKRREYYNNHKNKVKYVCHYCQVHFYHKPNFDFHISKLESTGKCRIFEKVNNLYLCESCGEGFSWREKLEKHLRLAEQHGTHNQKELLMYGDFQCNMCGKTFNKRTTYLQHVKWHEEREDIPCVICGTMFKQMDLRHHLMEVHSNDSLPCCYCGKLFTSRKYLEKHELIHQGGNFPCPECGKSFGQKSNMQQHLKTHMLDKDYSCDHCGQTFNQRAGLCQHLRKHFGPAEFNLECEVCGQYFSSDYNLKFHKKKIHNMHIEGFPDEMSDHSEYLSSSIHSHMTPDDVRDKPYGAANSAVAVKSMLGVSLGSSLGSSLSSSLSLSSMKQEGANESMDDGQLHVRDAAAHVADMRHLTERRDTPGLMKDAMDAEDQMRMTQHHSMAVNEDPLHMPQDLTRMTASQAHMNDDSGRMSAAPQSQHMSDMRNSVADSPGRITDTPHMTDNLGRMAAENFGRMTGTPGGYLAEHLRRMAENQSRMSDSMSHYDERDNYGRLGDNLRSMSRGSAGDPMGRLGDNLGRMTADNLSHMGVIRPTQTPSSTPQWPPHMQNHAALEGMNQSSQSQHALYPLPFWPYDPSLRQYHH